MNLLLISNIVLWVLMVIMGVIIYALTRQVGVLFERIAPAGALAMNQKLKVGDPAPELSVQTLTRKVITIGGLSHNGKSRLLFFLSPQCLICKSLLPALKSCAKHENDWLEIILCSDGDDQDHKKFIHQNALMEFPYVISELLGKTYGIAKLPYGIIVCEKGMIVSLGVVNSREHLDSLFEAKESKIASIQDYLKKN